MIIIILIDIFLVSYKISFFNCIKVSNSFRNGAIYNLGCLNFYNTKSKRRRTERKNGAKRKEDEELTGNRTCTWRVRFGIMRKKRRDAEFTTIQYPQTRSSSLPTWSFLLDGKEVTRLQRWRLSRVVVDGEKKTSMSLVNLLHFKRTTEVEERQRRTIAKTLSVH